MPKSEFLKVGESIEFRLSSSATIVEILDKPADEEEQRKIVDRLFEKYKTRSGITIYDGISFSDDPRLKPRIKPNSIYVLEV